MIPTILLVRHGSTAFNSRPATERLRGWLDVPLNAEGKAEAKRIARVLCTYEVSRVISSPLVRAAYTGQEIAEQCDVKFSTDERLKPWNLGQLQGQKVQAILPKLRFYVEHPEKPVPGGEKLYSFRDRYFSILTETAEEAKRNPDQGAPVLVAHTRNLLMARAILASGGLDNHEFDEGVLTDYASQQGTGEGYALTFTRGDWHEQEIKGGTPNTGS